MRQQRQKKKLTAEVYCTRTITTSDPAEIENFLSAWRNPDARFRLGSWQVCAAHVIRYRVEPGDITGVTAYGGGRHEVGDAKGGEAWAETRREAHKKNTSKSF